MSTNRLALEKSPYLLQHAHNPVDWYPWGEEAFAKARSEDKPIFLSVGYSTCHWCHVMERESFESEEIAGVLNQHFVAIKVDREERPDVDRMYMLFVQASTGSGGWPMSVWLTPQRKPFFGGTYFPPDNRYGRPGFKAVLEQLGKAWRQDRARIEDSGDKVIEQLREYSSLGARSDGAGREVLDRAYQGFQRIFDSRLGGFGRAPKFPRPSIHNFLLRYYAETKQEEALEMVLTTLREMGKGGMNDQIGGGFHRYSVDERWFVPHFEKMLYDQAQLAVSYLEAFQITRDGQYAAAARDIFTYLLRDMTDPGGGFYSAEDADSAADPADLHHKSEGAFYIWRKQEIEASLGPRVAEMFCHRYGVEAGGNVEEDPHEEFRGANILYQAHAVDDAAARVELQQASAKLLQIRSRRPRPLRDDKVLSSWNGMMISAFAKGAQILNEARYAEAARAAADFLRRHLWDDQRQILLRRHRGGESAIDGFLDDYAFCGLGLLDLYEATFDARDFEWAVRLADRAVELFADTDNGGFFSTTDDGSLLRLKDDYDGAEPSGNSGMAMLLLRLARMTDRADFRAAAEHTLRAFASRMEEAGTGVPQMLVAHSFALGRPREIVLAGSRDDPAMIEMLAAIRRRFLPGAVILRVEQSARPMPALNGVPTAYVCENFACNLPVTSAIALDELLE
ncbi:MAG: thioredoxin domain-containing protein [Acidobacteriota bacterium]|nr:thioredoxin domain-containing protein [Acidobacteriota bacterium]